MAWILSAWWKTLWYASKPLASRAFGGLARGNGTLILFFLLLMTVAESKSKQETRAQTISPNLQHRQAVRVS
jgi:hypothetical protein